MPMPVCEPVTPTGGGVERYIGRIGLVIGAG